MASHRDRRLNRVVVLGRGGAGKSVFARRLAAITEAPVIELDKEFWQAGLYPLPAGEWTARQQQLITAERWILDGDLGPYDVLDVRLGTADTVIILDFPLLLCAWRAGRRPRESADFWRWVLTYRRRYLPKILTAITVSGPQADVRVLKHPREAEQLLRQLRAAGGSTDPC